MADIADRAAKAEQRNLNHSLAQALHRPAEPPQWIEEGQVLCLDCTNPIPEARLKAKPDAARCTFCQSVRDRRQRLGLDTPSGR